MSGIAWLFQKMCVAMANAEGKYYHPKHKIEDLRKKYEYHVLLHWENAMQDFYIFCELLTSETVSEEDLVILNLRG